jgi:membrane-bound inhibitor of C-type lysozyme
MSVKARTMRVGATSTTLQVKTMKVEAKTMRVQATSTTLQVKTMKVEATSTTVEVTPNSTAIVPNHVGAGFPVWLATKPSNDVLNLP